MKSRINLPSASKKNIREAINLLSSRDATERNRAQSNLIEIGKPAVAPLLKLTKQPDTELRREAAALLGNIGDPSAVPVLIDLLDDESFEVRWRSAESLIKMKRETVIPLFRELQRKKRFDSLWFLEGVHHILRKLDEEGYLGPPSQKVLEAFDDPVKQIAIPVAAEKALESLGDLI